VTARPKPKFTRSVPFEAVRGRNTALSVTWLRLRVELNGRAPIAFAPIATAPALKL
jgi:hypothetical protein